jgi:hypothetical protein
MVEDRTEQSEAWQSIDDCREETRGLKHTRMVSMGAMYSKVRASRATADEWPRSVRALATLL